MADSPGKKSGGHDDDCSYDTGVDSTPQPRRFHVSGSALPQRTFSSEDEQSDGDRTPTNSPGRRSQRRSSSLKDQQSSGDNTPTNSPGRRSQRRSSPFRDVLEKMLVIDGRLQREDFRAPRDQRRLPSSNKFQIISGQENEDSDAMVKSATSGAGLHLRLKNNLYELKAILKWHEIFDKYCGAVFDNVMNDHFMLLIETCMTAGKILLMAWHDDTMSESMDDAERPEKALEDFLVVIFTTWTTLVNALNDIYAVPAKATVSNESCKGKRELIGNTVTIIAEHVKFAVLEAERDTLSRECYITMAAKEIGKLSRNGAEKRGGSYMESDVTS